MPNTENQPFHACLASTALISLVIDVDSRPPLEVSPGSVGAGPSH